MNQAFDLTRSSSRFVVQDRKRSIKKKKAGDYVTQNKTLYSKYTREGRGLQKKQYYKANILYTSIYYRREGVTSYKTEVSRKARAGTFPGA